MSLQQGAKSIKTQLKKKIYCTVYTSLTGWSEKKIKLGLRFQQRALLTPGIVPCELLHKKPQTQQPTPPPQPK